MANPTIRSMQYLRAIAALLVVWVHIAREPGMPKVPLLAGTGAAAGVYLFFVISGFIMVVTTSTREKTPWVFLRARLIRIVPLYWLMTLAMIAVALVVPSAFQSLKFTAAAVVKSLLFVPYWSLAEPGKIYPVLVPGWTLNYEMFFYALFAASLFLRRYRLVAMLGVLGALMLAGLIWRPSNPIAVTYTRPLLQLFAAGMVIAYAWQRSRVWGALPVAIAAIITGAVLLCLGNGGAWREELAMLGCALIVAGSLHRQIIGLKSRVLGALGDASYSIYLSHLFTLGALRLVWARVFPVPCLCTELAFMAVALMAAALVGVLVYRWVERPIISFMRHSNA